MPISSNQISTLQAAVDEFAGQVAGLVPDPDPNPLQVALDEANATIADLQAKISASKVHLAAADAADASGDTARAAALDALG